MKIIVTGGAGFIGSAVVRHIINHTQDSVVNLDKLTYAGNLESLAEVTDNTRYAFEQVDICDRAELDRVFEQHHPDMVMNLSAENKRQLWIPEGFAHGFYVTSLEAEFIYKCTDYYNPAAEVSIAWDDPELAITWPLEPMEIPQLSEKDKHGKPFNHIQPLL